MKNIIVILMAVIPVLGFAQADSISADTTVKTIIKPKSVVVVKENGVTKLHVTGTADDPNYNYKFEIKNDEAAGDSNTNSTEEWGLNLPFLKNDGRLKSTFISGGEDIYIDMMWPESKSSGMKTSWELGIGRVISFNWLPDVNRRVKFTFGIGLGVRSISFKHDRRLYLNDGHLTLDAPAEGEKVRSSKILECEVRFPFMFTAPIYKAFKFSIGAAGIWNVHSKANSTWEVGDTKYTESFKGLHQRQLNFELVGTLGFDDAVGVTVHYRPLSDFTTVYGPEFKTISLGLSFNF